MPWEHSLPLRLHSVSTVLLQRSYCDSTTVYLFYIKLVKWPYGTVVAIIDLARCFGICYYHSVSTVLLQRSYCDSTTVYLFYIKLVKWPYGTVVAIIDLARCFGICYYKKERNLWIVVGRTNKSFQHGTSRWIQLEYLQAQHHQANANLMHVIEWRHWKQVSMRRRDWTWQWLGMGSQLFHGPYHM